MVESKKSSSSKSVRTVESKKSKSADMIDKSVIEQLRFTINVLSLAVQQIYSSLKIQEDLNILLQKHMSETEYKAYERDAEQVLDNSARVPRDDVSEERLITEVSILLNVLKDRSLGSDEIADILNLDIFQVEDTLNKYRKAPEQQDDLEAFSYSLRV